MLKSIIRVLVVVGAFALGVSLAADEYDHECTSWLVFSDLTGNGTNILHKNRDAKPRNLMPLKSKADSPRKWIGLCDGRGDNLEKIFVCMGINASGLAAVVNSGEATVEPSDPKGNMGTPAIIQNCLAECDTAGQAVEKLREILKSRRYSHGKAGSIFFFMDTKEAYIAEVTAERCSVARYDHGYAFRANIWHNADMASVADNSIDKYLNSCNREYMVIQNLNKFYRNQGKIAIANILEMSRDSSTPAGSPIVRTLCSKSTNSAATLEINLKYPDVLSTGYFLIGPPRHTISIPFPICAEEFLPNMSNLHWSKAAWQSFDEHGFDAEVPQAWRDFEADSLQKYRSAQSEAEKLLNSGRREEAIRLLNSTTRTIWLAAEKLLQIN